ncbi:hypothetical protein D3C84_513590 [compost metagenome]
MALGGMDAGVGQGGELLHPFGKRQVVVTGGDDGHRLPEAAEPGSHRPAGQRLQQCLVGLFLVAAHEAQPEGVAHLGELGAGEEFAPQPPGQRPHAKPAQPLEAHGMALLLPWRLQQKLAEAVDQHQPPHLVGQSQRQLQRHHGPERQPHHPGGFRLLLEPAGHVRRQGGHIEGPLLHALAVAAQIQRHHPVVLGEVLDLGLPVEAGGAKAVQQEQQGALPRAAQGQSMGFHYLVATHPCSPSRLDSGHRRPCCPCCGDTPLSPLPPGSPP